MYIVCNLNWKPDVVVHTCNSSNWETEVVGIPRIHCPLMYRIGVSATNVIKPQRRACMGNAYWRSKLCYIFKSFYCISVSARAHTCTHTCVHVRGQLMKIGSFLQQCVSWYLTYIIYLAASAFTYWTILLALGCILKQDLGVVEWGGVNIQVKETICTCMKHIHTYTHRG